VLTIPCKQRGPTRGSPIPRRASPNDNTQVPLNNYVLNPSSTCTPLWLPLFTTVQCIALVKILLGGVACNELINEVNRSWVTT